ncbi:SWIM zinc finger family protein [Streptomyces sp. NPDC005485]|uniref:SWIM zinc finger family protein n=1 Tax=Streptomyces sp. NPDC005485 TaxID=3155591 RepID=UPI0033B527D0
MNGPGDEKPPAQEARPADVARRALRAAREREARGSETESHPAGGQEDAAPAEVPAPEPRPGDVAREALRRGSEPPAAVDEALGDVRPDERAPSGAVRPGDIAREALRAAREQAARSRTQAGGREVDTQPGAGRRPEAGKPTGSRGRGRTPRRGTDTRAQDLRDLLAGAFQLPDAEAAPAGDAVRSDPAARVPDGTPDNPVAPPGDAERTDDVTRPDSEPPDREPQDHEQHDNEPQDNDRTRHGSSLTGATTPAVGEAPGHSAPEEAPEDHPVPGARRARHRDDVRHRDDPLTQRPTRQSTSRGARPVAEVPGATPIHSLPRSMAAPGRDGDLRRTFAAFPPRSAGGGGADAFAETWWGNAWVTALEEGALDAARLARGRAYAGKGSVDAITVTPGLVLAYVHGSRPRPYRVQVRLRTLADADWDRFLDAAAERPGHIAALLDKEMPQSLAECGVALLPGPGDLEPHCSCPDSGHPCKHAAALCYRTARLLDEDPFVLFLLRGRGERELLDALSRRNAARAARAAQEQEPAPLPGVRASDALKPRALPPLPAPLPPPAHPQQPPAYPGAPGGPDPFALDQLATDAAARAHTLLTAGRDPVAELTLWQDAVRLAAARPGSGLTAATRALYSALASAAARTPSDLARAVAAWRQGGLEGLTVLEEPWDPPAGRFDRARPLLLAADLPAFRPWRNQLTHPRGHAQLRLGHNGLWYAYESEPGHDDWWPRGTPDLDPVGALTGLGAPGEL